MSKFGANDMHAFRKQKAALKLPSGDPTIDIVSGLVFLLASPYQQLALLLRHFDLIASESRHRKRDAQKLRRVARGGDSFDVIGRISVRCRPRRFVERPLDLIEAKQKRRTQCRYAHHSRSPFQGAPPPRSSLERPRRLSRTTTGRPIRRRTNLHEYGAAADSFKTHPLRRRGRPGPSCARLIRKHETILNGTPNPNRSTRVRANRIKWGAARSGRNWEHLAGSPGAVHFVRAIWTVKLGTKRQCQACGAKFYDLAKRPVVCARCGAEVVLDRMRRPPRAKAADTAAPEGT